MLGRRQAAGTGCWGGQEGDGGHHRASIRNHREDQDVLWGQEAGLGGAASWGWYPREASEDRDTGEKPAMQFLRLGWLSSPLPAVFSEREA